jgi:DNA-binding transcriptional regulator YhcF (GntR family)/predicted GIY-YIG superfamily endonuclease
MTEPSERTALYRLFDASGALLYVGITSDPENRWRQHALLNKAWWPNVATKKIDWIADRATAGAAEVDAIKSEAPRHNKLHARSPLTFAGLMKAIPASADSAGRPKYEQVADAFREAIRDGLLSLGDRLPGVVETKEHFKVTIVTVQKAFEILKVEGLIFGRQGAGVWVSDPSDEAGDALPLEDPTRLAAVLAEHVSRADLATLTQALVALLAKDR